MWVVSKNNSKSLTISLDAEKAFDSVRWESLYLVLQRFGFNDAVIGYLKTIYHSPTGRIKINSNLSNAVTLEFTRCHFNKNIKMNELTEISLIHVIIDSYKVKAQRKLVFRLYSSIQSSKNHSTLYIKIKWKKEANMTEEEWLNYVKHNLPPPALASWENFHGRISLGFFYHS